MLTRLGTSARHYYPVAAFFGGFLWDALTIGQRVRPLDLWRLGAFLGGAALLILWLARREQRAVLPPEPDARFPWRSRAALLGWRLPELLLPFFFGGIFSALFIFYLKSAGHLGAWSIALLLGGLLVANEFWGQRYGQRFTLTWALFALCAILLLNFVLPHAAGSLSPHWFILSTLLGAGLAHALYWLAPGHPGRILPAWLVAVALLTAWHFDSIAPVPLVKRAVAIGQQFTQRDGQYLLQVETAPWWALWRDQNHTAHLAEGSRLYGVSAVYAPGGMTAPLEHRWERHDGSAWQTVSRIRFVANGGRTQGFRGYSYVHNPAPGDWRLIVATQDGKTITQQPIRIERGEPESPVWQGF